MQKVTINYTSGYTQLPIERMYFLPLEEKQFDSKCDELKDRKINYTLTFEDVQS